MSESPGPSNWASATAAFRATFLTTAPRSYVWHPQRDPRPDRYWIDDVPVSEPVFYVACTLKNLPAARALWLAQTAAA
jgi:hypothetical protein